MMCKRGLGLKMKFQLSTMSILIIRSISRAFERFFNPPPLKLGKFDQNCATYGEFETYFLRFS